MSNQPPFETDELRRMLSQFLDQEVDDPILGSIKVGNYTFGVYAFFDYDGEPIYVGQTYEMLRTRIRRHLTNQRTDAVAMHVLDPFEVYEIEVWPLPKYQGSKASNRTAREDLDALEYQVFQLQLSQSRFNAVLNEKEPYTPSRTIPIPNSIRGKIVSDEVFKLRKHSDTRIARRAQTLANLAQVISERQVKSGLRKTLVTQATRLQWLAEQRYLEGTGDEGSPEED